MNPLHYPDIERCKRLQSLGMKGNIDILYVEGELLDYHRACKYHAFDSLETVFAFTVTEMIDVIPDVIEINGKLHYFRMNKNFVWFLGAKRIENNIFHSGEHKPIAYALADLIFWLKENHPTSLPF